MLEGFDGVRCSSSAFAGVSGSFGPRLQGFGIACGVMRAAGERIYIMRRHVHLFVAVVWMDGMDGMDGMDTQQTV